LLGIQATVGFMLRWHREDFNQLHALLRKCVGRLKQQGNEARIGVEGRQLKRYAVHLSGVHPPPA
jgi:hypothetical protein